MSSPPTKKYKKNIDGSCFQKIDKCFSYEVSDDQKVILFLQQNEQKALEGSGVIQCINGRIEINGFELTPKHPPTKYYSFSNHRLLSFKALPFHENMSVKKLAEVLKKSNVNIETMSNFKEKLKLSHCCIVLLSKMESEFNYLEGIERFNYLSRSEKPIVSDRMDESITFPEEYLRVCSEWNDLLRDGESPILLLCGGKNTGKSTLARFIINTSLNRKEKVAFFECDVGQTEFIPPGCVGLNVVTTPVLGPPYCHQQVPEIMSFVGLTNTKLDPERYLECIKFVWEYRRQNLGRHPVVINTMGWCRNLGVSILAEIVEITRPAMVVQLDGPLSRDNFPAMTSNFVRDLKLGLTDFYPLQKKSMDTDLLDHKLHQLQIPFERTSSYSAKVTAADYRGLSLLSHLTRGFPPSSPGESRCVDSYVLSYKKLVLRSCCRDAAGDHLLVVDLFDRNICSLCILDDVSIEESCRETKSPNSLNPICRSLGLGYVLSISKESQTMTLITSVNKSLVREVNCLLVGMVEAPKMMANFHENSPSIGVPYLDYPLNLFGVAPHKPKGQCVTRLRKPKK